MRFLDLFSGIGGFSLGLERAGHRTVAFCEIDAYCRKVLARHWPHVPCYEDIRELTADRLRADGIEVDGICGGFPCQDISLAGKGAGIEGPQSGLWSEYARLVCELGPEVVCVENVTALLDRGLERVLRDLAEIGYDAEWECISANAVGAPHMRDRIWITAYPHADGMRPQRIRAVAARAWPKQQFEGLLQDQIRVSVPAGKIGGVADGVPHRSHRLKATGNAIVPQVAEIVGRSLTCRK